MPSGNLGYNTLYVIGPLVYIMSGPHAGTLHTNNYYYSGAPELMLPNNNLESYLLALIRRSFGTHDIRHF